MKESRAVKVKMLQLQSQRSTTPTEIPVSGMKAALWAPKGKSLHASLSGIQDSF
jgi:hypothetical protein